MTTPPPVPAHDPTAALPPLNAATTLLDAVARESRRVPPACVLLCLLAVEHLASVGGSVAPFPMPLDDPAASIQTAMARLAELDEVSFGSDAVLDAARAARRAFRALT